MHVLDVLLLNQNFCVCCEDRYLVVIDDIWETESWKTIKLAIDDDKNCGGRIIITTRKLEVATEADEVYKLQPLPYGSSRELLYARIYGHKGRYVNNHSDEEISKKFIRKCGGIPLAIITMASLLAGKPFDKWSELYNSIDFGSKDNREAENTMKILSFSYYDLPSYLMTCLLYLCAFQEDSVIDKHSVVWKWVAEGFILENEGISLFEIGEGYFNDLINRSMIQMVEYEYDDNIITGCRVHDVVLDFIHSMSCEENFFMVLDSNDQGTLVHSHGNVRRLANHGRIIGHTHHHTPKLRSFIALSCVIETWAPLSSLTLLRVLAIENCRPSDGRHVQIEHIGQLIHLRHLSLHGTWIDRVPEEIGALRFLQFLDLSKTYIKELPSSCSLLKRLAYLHTPMTDGVEALDDKLFSVEGMTSLEELAINVWNDELRRRLVKGLGCLRELRVLRARFVR
jgi:disease resistance protein RPM1